MNNDAVNEATEAVEAAADAVANNNAAVGLAFAGGVLIGIALLKGIQLTKQVIAERKANAVDDALDEDEVEVTVNNSEDKDDK